jgi:hypothetical protein
MQIVIVYGKPHVSLSSGLEPISDLMYWEMIERSEIESVEYIDYD